MPKSAEQGAKLLAVRIVVRQVCYTMLLVLAGLINPDQGMMQPWAHPEELDVAIQLSQRGKQSLDAGDEAEAISYAEKALAIVEKIKGLHADTAMSQENLAGLYMLTGDYAKAEPLYQNSFKVRTRIFGPNHPLAAVSMRNLGKLFYTIGDYSKAEASLHKAQIILERNPGPNAKFLAGVMNEFGELYRTKGSYKKAERYYLKALAVVEKELGSFSIETATALMNLAKLYQATGAFSKAEPLYKRALTIQEKQDPKDSYTMDIKSNLATLYVDTGAYDMAEPIFLELLAAAHESNALELATCLNNLGEVYKNIGDYAKAISLLERSLEVRTKKKLGYKSMVTGLVNLASAYLATGEVEKSEPLLLQALEIQKNNAPKHFKMGTILGSLASVYTAAGKRSEAEPLYAEALSILEATFGSDHPILAQVRGNLVVFRWSQGLWPEALDQARRVVSIQDVNTRRFLVWGEEERKRAYMASLEASTSALVSFALDAPGETAPAATELGLEVVLQRKGRVLDVQADSFLRLRRSLASEDKVLLAKYQKATTALATLSMKGSGGLPSDQHLDRLTKEQQRISLLETELSARSNRFRAEVTRITVAQVQRKIPSKTALLEWVRYRPFKPKATKGEPQWGAPRYAAYILKADGPPILVSLPEDAEVIDKQLSQLLSATRRPGSNLALQVMAQELGRSLLSPLHAHLGETERVFLSPDGLLNLLPFGIIQDAQGRYLFERYEITYLTSGRDLLRPVIPHRMLQPMLIVADPDFGPINTSGEQQVSQGACSTDVDRSALRFGRLKCTGEEARALRTLLKLSTSQVLTQGQATEAAVKQVRRPRMLHLATHGFFLPDLLKAETEFSRGASLEPDNWPTVRSRGNALLQSGLALAGANRGISASAADDGILTALEVASLNLEGTELAVLSACETGIGEIKNGEGVYGLRRAFVLAGVRTQVVSLWKVDDKATKDFMVDYYKQVQAGNGRSAALRAAQRETMKRKGRAHPYYWAAFIVIGDPTPIPLDGPTIPIAS